MPGGLTENVEVWELAGALPDASSAVGAMKPGGVRRYVTHQSPEGNRALKSPTAWDAAGQDYDHECD